MQDGRGKPSDSSSLITHLKHHLFKIIIGILKGEFTFEKRFRYLTFTLKMKIIDINEFMHLETKLRNLPLPFVQYFVQYGIYSNFTK